MNLRIEVVLGDADRALLEGWKAEILMALVDIQQAIARINDATNNIAADIVRLKERISTGLSQADVDAIQAQLQNAATALEAVANDPENPDPQA